VSFIVVTGDKYFWPYVFCPPSLLFECRTLLKESAETVDRCTDV